MKASCYQSLGTLPETTSLKKILFSSPLAINCTQLCRRVGAMNLPWPCCAGSHSSQVMSHSNSAPCLFLWLSHAFFSHLCNAPWTSERVIWKSTYGWALKMPFDIIYLTFWKILLSVLSNRGENQLIDGPRTQQRYMSQGQKPWEPGDALHTTAQKKKRWERRDQESDFTSSAWWCSQSVKGQPTFEPQAPQSLREEWLVHVWINLLLSHVLGSPHSNLLYAWFTLAWGSIAACLRFKNLIREYCVLL